MNGLQGKWAARLPGAYVKQPKKQSLSCPHCFRSGFANKGCLTRHINSHAYLQVKQRNKLNFSGQKRHHSELEASDNDLPPPKRVKTNPVAPNNASNSIEIQSNPVEQQSNQPQISHVKQIST